MIENVPLAINLDDAAVVVTAISQGQVSGFALRDADVAVADDDAAIPAVNSFLVLSGAVCVPTGQ